MSEIPYVPSAVSAPFSVDTFYGLYISHFPRQDHFPEETHPFFEILFVREGVTAILLDGKRVDAHAGEMILYPPGQRHLRLDPETTHCVSCSLLFSLRGQTDMLPGGVPVGLTAEEAAFFFNALKEIHPCFEWADGSAMIKRFSADEPPEAMAYLKSVLESFLYHIVWRSRKIPAQEPSPADRQQNAQVVAYLRENLGGNLSTADIGRHFSLSPSALQKTFRRQYGRGIMDYYIDLKIHLAEEQLLLGASVTEAANAAGFSSLPHFSALFKKRTGHSPSARRQAARIDDDLSGKNPLPADSGPEE